MPKVTYILISAENAGHTTPLAVSGYSGKLYGHAEYDAAYGAHAFRVPEAQWVGGMDLDMAKNMHRRFQRWVVRAEVAPDLESPEGKLAQEIDALKAENADLAAKLKDTQLLALASVPPSPPDDVPTDRDPEPQEEVSSGEAVPDFSGMGLPELEAEVKKVEAMGESIVITGHRTKVKLRVALEDFYAERAKK